MNPTAGRASRSLRIGFTRSIGIASVKVLAPPSVTMPTACPNRLRSGPPEPFGRSGRSSARLPPVAVPVARTVAPVSVRSRPSWAPIKSARSPTARARDSPERDGRESRSLDLQDRDVVQALFGDERRWQCPTVVERRLEGLHPAHARIVRDDVPLPIDDEPAMSRRGGRELPRPEGRGHPAHPSRACALHSGLRQGSATIRRIPHGEGVRSLSGWRRMS